MEEEGIDGIINLDEDAPIVDNATMVNVESISCLEPERITKVFKFVEQYDYCNNTHDAN